MGRVSVVPVDALSENQTMKKSLVSTLVATAVLCGWHSAPAATIDFEDLGIPLGSQTSDGDLNSGGYLFDSDENALKRINAFQDYADSGSTYLQIRGLVGDNLVTMSPIGGGTFRLNSLQLGEGFHGGTGSLGDNATSLLVTGNLLGGGTVSTTITFDGINDGPGGLADFQLATFNSGWINLTSVVFDGLGGNDGRLGIDSVIVNVPEPSSLALAGIGILACVWRRLARKA